MAKWVMILTEIDIEYAEHKEIKGQVITDQLIEAPIYAKNHLTSKFTDKSMFLINHTT